MCHLMTDGFELVCLSQVTIHAGKAESAFGRSSRRLEYPHPQQLRSPVQFTSQVHAHWLGQLAKERCQCNKAYAKQVFRAHSKSY